MNGDELYLCGATMSAYTKSLSLRGINFLVTLASVPVAPPSSDNTCVMMETSSAQKVPASSMSTEYTAVNTKLSQHLYDGDDMTSACASRRPAEPHRYCGQTT